MANKTPNINLVNNNKEIFQQFLTKRRGGKWRGVAAVETQCAAAPKSRNHWIRNAVVSGGGEESIRDNISIPPC
jgi:hypothetical protein